MHWARDAEEANAIIVGLVNAALATPKVTKASAHEVVKIKSMVTQEIDLNEAPRGGGHRRLGD